MHRIQTLYFPNEMAIFAPHFPQLVEYGPTISLTPCVYPAFLRSPRRTLGTQVHDAKSAVLIQLCIDVI